MKLKKKLKKITQVFLNPRSEYWDQDNFIKSKKKSLKVEIDKKKKN
jgi:hypothetical protein